MFRIFKRRAKQVADRLAINWASRWPWNGGTCQVQPHSSAAYSWSMEPVATTPSRFLPTMAAT